MLNGLIYQARSRRFTLLGLMNQTHWRIFVNGLDKSSPYNRSCGSSTDILYPLLPTDGRGLIYQTRKHQSDRRGLIHQTH
jgi:hypothetical protein